MRAGYLHLASGIAGDMFLGALVDAGAPLDVMEAAVQAVAGDEVHLTRSEVRRGGLRGVKIDVRVGDTVIDESGGSAGAREPAHAPNENERAHAHHHPHRAYTDIEQRIREAPLAEDVKSKAAGAFAVLARSESEVHGVPVSEVHFHELGSLDAMADIVGTVAGLDALGLDRLVHGPVAVGGGVVPTAHGTLPAPAPATLSVLEGRSCVLEEGCGELTTPTGAALLVTLAEEAPPSFQLRPESIGYGAGSRDVEGRPNLVRLLVGEAETARPRQVAVVEASLDDCTPEEGAHLLRDLLGAGALDATLTPLIMKKGRPGFLVRVIVPPEAGSEFARRVVERSPSLGARWRIEDRIELDRRIDRVRLGDGEVRVKVAILPDGTERIHPEYEDLAGLAGKRGVPLAQVRVEVEQAWRSNR